MGEFASHQVRTQINILIQPEYLELRSALIRILAGHPKARQEVLSVFQNIERKAIQPPVIEGVAHEDPHSGTPG